MQTLLTSACISYQSILLAVIITYPAHSPSVELTKTTLFPGRCYSHLRNSHYILRYSWAVTKSNIQQCHPPVPNRGSTSRQTAVGRQTGCEFTNISLGAGRLAVYMKPTQVTSIVLMNWQLNFISIDFVPKWAQVPLTRCWIELDFSSLCVGLNLTLHPN
jgi:hypothetical protein